MADNIGILVPGTPDKNVGADEISSVHYYRFKPIYGSDGVNKGDVEINNALPVGPAQAGAYEAVVEKLYSFFTASYQSLSLTNLATCRLLYVTNWTDTDIKLSFDAGTTTHVVIPAKTMRGVTIPSGTTAVWSRYHTSAGTVGYAWFEVIR